MPNWVYNGLTVEGNPEQVKKMRDQLNKPFVYSITPIGDLSFDVKETKYSNPVFAFHNIYSHLDAGIPDEVYHSQPASPKTDDNWFKFDTNDWYNFNIREWGTKWDVAISDNAVYSNTNMEEAENGENYVVHYNFETAWSRPLGAIEKLSAQYPTLLFTLSYEEETGWGGEMEFLRGEVISESEYENRCPDCDATDQMEYCENECGEVCSSCNYISGIDERAMAECQTHMVLLPIKTYTQEEALNV